MVIKTITAIVSVDKDGNEGIIGQKLGADWMPFVFADPNKIHLVLPMANEMTRQTGIPFKILQFSTREDVTEKFK